jgi:hypothetical protein
MGRQLTATTPSTTSRWYPALRGPEGYLAHKTYGVTSHRWDVYRDLGELAIATGWADNAKHHFTSYASLRESPDRSTVARQGMSAEVARSTGTLPRHSSGSPNSTANANSSTNSMPGSPRRSDRARLTVP